MPSAKHKTKAPPPPVASGLFTIVEKYSDLMEGDILYIPDYLRFSNGTASGYDISNGETCRSENRAGVVSSLFGDPSAFASAKHGARFLLAVNVAKVERAASRTVGVPGDLSALLSDEADVGFDIVEDNGGMLVTQTDWRILDPDDFKILDPEARAAAVIAGGTDGTHVNLAGTGTVGFQSEWLLDTIETLAAQLGLKDACIRASRLRSGNGNSGRNIPGEADDVAHALINTDPLSFFEMPAHFPDANDTETSGYSYTIYRRGRAEERGVVTETIERVIHNSWQRDSWLADHEKKLVTRARFLPNLVRKGAVILRRANGRSMLDEFAAAVMDLRARIIANLCKHASDKLASMREALDSAVVRYDDLGDQWRNAAQSAADGAPDLASILAQMTEQAFVEGQTKYGAK